MKVLVLILVELQYRVRLGVYYLWLHFEGHMLWWRHRFWYEVMRHRVRRLRLLRTLIARSFRDGGRAQRITTALYPRPGFSNVEEGKIVWEAPWVVTIWDDQGPICGMSLILRRNAVCIHQLQGVAGADLTGELRDWPQRFVGACMSFARRTGMHSVRIYNADQSLFYHHPELAVPREEYAAARKALQQRLRRRYEGTARKMNFRAGKYFSEWVCSQRARSSLE